MSAEPMGVDPKSLELARHFLSDFGGENTVLADLLAESIQGAVEDWLEEWTADWTDPRVVLSAIEGVGPSLRSTPRGGK